MTVLKVMFTALRSRQEQQPASALYTAATEATTIRAVHKQSLLAFSSALQALELKRAFGLKATRSGCKIYVHISTTVNLLRMMIKSRAVGKQEVHD